MTLRAQRVAVVGVLLAASASAGVFAWGLRHWTAPAPGADEPSGRPDAAVDSAPDAAAVRPPGEGLARQAESDDGGAIAGDENPCPRGCPADRVCSAGACIRAVCGAAAPGVPCRVAGTALLGSCCEGRCLSPDAFSTDLEACGRCGEVCPRATLCRDGRCSAPDGGPVTASPHTCPSDGYEVWMTGDRSGTQVSCKRQGCAGAQDGAACDHGVCCDGRCLIDTEHDPRNCGGCGNICRGRDTCVRGDCVPHARCGAGADPDVPCALPSGEDGSCCGEACIDTDRDSQHCGTCDRACPDGRFCKGGECWVTSCVGGTASDRCRLDDDSIGECCRDSCVEGPTRFAADPRNCGACGLVCPAGSSCAGGRCVDPDAGSALDCDADGGCAAGFVCHDERCLPSSCEQAADGDVCVDDGGLGLCCHRRCVDTNTDSSNCGACGVSCRGGFTCGRGACRATRPSAQEGEASFGP